MKSVARIKLVYTYKRIHLQILRNPSEATLGERKQYLATKENILEAEFSPRL